MSLVGSVSVAWLALLPAVAASDTVEAPWQRSGLDFETGVSLANQEHHFEL